MRSAARLSFFTKPWVWSYIGALLVWLAAVTFTRGYGAGGMVTAGLALAVFSVIASVAQMFVITLGPGNVDLSLPANIGLASAVAMKVMAGSDSLIAAGLVAALTSGIGIGIFNYLLIRLLRIPPIIATLSASFIIQSIGISYGRGLQIKPPPGFADFTTAQLAGIPWLAIGLFAGLRTAELDRLDWSHISEGAVRIEPHTAKTASRRVVDLSPNLIAWLLPYRKALGPIRPTDCRNRRERLCRHLRLSWKSNGMRHSFASYHLALNQDSARIALALGHSNSNLVFRHYRELVTSKEAREYFALVPPAGEQAEKLVAFGT